MLPATLAQDVKRQIRHYLEATFNFRRREEETALSAFINDPENGLFKGPWVQLRRPYRPAHETYDPAEHFDIRPDFHPFRHQWQAWQRLSSKGRDPESTIVTTGTGSGKTECFLFPLLDHCLRAIRRGEKGVKAIILYPMNALAADQAGRFTDEVFSRPELHVGAGNDRKALIKIGLYTGRSGAGESGAEVSTAVKAMRAEGDECFHITDHDAMQEDPPDILLTNYKMLDYLLLRPKDQRIWRYNEPGRLRFLVLDELHTYDGAQGADVACLVRRIKTRLDVPEGGLCCVGTSATIAGGREEEEMDPLQRLADFAGILFEESFTPGMIINEDNNRLDIAEMVVPEPNTPEAFPSASDCTPRDDETVAGFAQRVAPLWGAPEFPLSAGNPWLDREIQRPTPEKYWGLAVGDWLRRQELFKALLEITAAPVLTWDALIEDLSARFFVLRAAGDHGARSQVVAAFFALVAQARDLRSGRALPKVPTHVQIWVRELRRLGRYVQDVPKFGWIDEKRVGSPILPVAHCSECGESVWVGLSNPDMDNQIRAKGVNGFQLIDDAARIYQGWGFEGSSQSPNIVVLSPWQADDEGLSGPDQLPLPTTHWYLAPDSLVVREGPGNCPVTEARTFRVKVNRETRRQDNGRVVGQVRCPHCEMRNSLMFIGSRAATVSSVAIDEMFGSLLNSDPKLLAFTDSVQDASHRAGFFSARTYHFTFRTALQRIIDDAGPSGVPLNEVGDRLLAYWSVQSPGRPGVPLEALATLMPPDLHEYGPYLAFRENAGKATPIPEPLRSEIAERLTWEAISEFGLMLTHGRTLELNGSSCVAWDLDVIDAIAGRLAARLPGIDTSFEGVDGDQLRLWILGILHRQRTRGGFAHTFVSAYVRSGLWGKRSRKKIVEGRETYPLHGRYTPRLMATGSNPRHDHMLTVTRTGAQDPWNIVWARRALGRGRLRLHGVSDAAIADLTRAFLNEGVAAGLLELLHREGDREYFAISPNAAWLQADGRPLVCDHSGHFMLRPPREAEIWMGASSLVYGSPRGRYGDAPFTDRQIYYRQRYRKGALRRVFAQEHTGLLTTEEREDLERRFNGGLHADDPNVITATSTLEMGIDIGDLSTTMLCSVPPTTASYLQRIGRAGRSTGTALVVSVVNQRPHDLFFFARPEEMLAGKIEPPGCWLDASAMLVRQYLAFCFDSAVKERVISELPSSGKQLNEQLQADSGPIIDLLTWMVMKEAALQDGFLARFGPEAVRPDTRKRFQVEAETVRLHQRIRSASSEFGEQLKSIETARRRLTDQKKELAGADDQIGLREIERELRMLKARTLTLNRTSALEVLTERGLLPNYAFPERGVRLTGAIHNEHQGDEDATISIDITRAAAVAIRELAPRNIFYTHGHQFEIQQLSLGNQSQPLTQEWGVCGKCGHMRLVEDMEKPEAKPACPQCGYDKQQQSQLDRAQRKTFLEFSRSGAISYMEYYDSMSGDRADERDQHYYRLVYSFDQTAGGYKGAVGTEGEPFGLEFRSSMILRQVNTGLAETPQGFQFGVEQKVPELGFPVCQDCGVVADGDATMDKVEHRRSCAGRKRTDKAFREGRTQNGYKWQRVYLYRQLRSEAIRLLLPPDVESEDIQTLRACLFLGLRLHFSGNPGHLLIEPQTLPDHKQDIRRHYLVIMDAVPGGTGFLKSLFEPKHAGEIPGQGIMTVLGLALNALQSCSCRLIGPDEDDTDGCYRCIRAYRLQHQSEEISRERGIKLLAAMIEAGKKRVVVEALDDLDTISLFGSVLEKRFVERLEAAVTESHGEWQKTLVKGTSGFRFRFGKDSRFWEIQLQPRLAQAQGVMTACQPDFMLTADDADVHPIAVFTDGFEFHAHPGQPTSRLADDAVKRRSVLDSGTYRVWSITWQDLLEGPEAALSLLHPRIHATLERKMQALGRTGLVYPPVAEALGNGFVQLVAFLRSPEPAGWQRLANEAGLIPLQVLANKGARGATPADLLNLHDRWRAGADIPKGTDDTWMGDLLHTTVLTECADLLVVANQGDVLASSSHKVIARLRLSDTAVDRASTLYVERWRRWLGLSNLLQFSGSARSFTTSEVALGSAPDLEFTATDGVPEAWDEVLAALLPSLLALAKKMAIDGVPVPEVEHYLEGASDDCFAEMAWPLAGQRSCLLIGDQMHFRKDWEDAGWRVVALDEVHGKGTRWLAGLLLRAEENV
ncbi:DEAD/DEAH box helicase [Bradyrhizobium sp. UFLA01-814]|uniref:DEAD/DEAH box helicase n=1 Tax=Bradyrhizobium sp. UFLA01-814 TaxID=3023480 RepID=UPI00398AE088